MRYPYWVFDPTTSSSDILLKAKKKTIQADQGILIVYDLYQLENEDLEVSGKGLIIRIKINNKEEKAGVKVKNTHVFIFEFFAPKVIGEPCFFQHKRMPKASFWSLD